MRLFTVGRYSKEVNQNISKGLIGKSIGGVAFSDYTEAEKWRKENYPTGLVYKLVEFTKANYKDNPTKEYPSKKIMTILTKMQHLSK